MCSPGTCGPALLTPVGDAGTGPLTPVEDVGPWGPAAHTGGEEAVGAHACRAELEAGHVHTPNARSITTHSGKAVHTGPRGASVPRTRTLRPLGL